MSRRTQSPAAIYGAPALERAQLELAVCSNPGCHEVLVFSTDALGRSRERCPKCDGVAPVRRIRPDEQRAVQSGLTNAQLLPRVAENQLRCQRCAKGVHGKDRFCSDVCRYAGRRGRTNDITDADRQHRAERLRGLNSLASRNKRRETMLAKYAAGFVPVFEPRTCPCGIVFTPAGPNQKWHAKDCPARGRAA